MASSSDDDDRPLGQALWYKHELLAAKSDTPASERTHTYEDGELAERLLRGHAFTRQRRFGQELACAEPVTGALMPEHNGAKHPVAPSDSILLEPLIAIHAEAQKDALANPRDLQEHAAQGCQPLQLGDGGESSSTDSAETARAGDKSAQNPLTNSECPSKGARDSSLHRETPQELPPKLKTEGLSSLAEAVPAEQGLIHIKENARNNDDTELERKGLVNPEENRDKWESFESQQRDGLGALHCKTALLGVPTEHFDQASGDVRADGSTDCANASPKPEARQAEQTAHQHLAEHVQDTTGEPCSMAGCRESEPASNNATSSGSWKAVQIIPQGLGYSFPTLGRMPLGASLEEASPISRPERQTEAYGKETERSPGKAADQGVNLLPENHIDSISSQLPKAGNAVEPLSRAEAMEKQTCASPAPPMSDGQKACMANHQLGHLTSIDTDHLALPMTQATYATESRAQNDITAEPKLFNKQVDIAVEGRPSQQILSTDEIDRTVLSNPAKNLGFIIPDSEEDD